MHEYAIVQALVERVEREARARRAAAVHRLSVRIGELSGVDIELLTTAFATFRDRTICEGADLAVERVAARWECPRCQERVGTGSLLRCQRCDAPARLAAGDEIVLDRIEMEVP
jgi:hydrogenase nickel incorporation protein HypA/HybF